MAGSTVQPVYYVVFFTTTYASLAEAQEHAPADIAAHVARSRELHGRGLVVLAGAFLDRPDEPLSTMAVCASREAAEEYVRGDPSVVKGQAGERVAHPCMGEHVRLRTGRRLATGRAARRSFRLVADIAGRYPQRR